MEPWDGPAAIAAFAGVWVVGGLDRNGLRPMRYVVTHDGLVIAGSETGMVVVPDHKIAERGGLGPGEMIGINLSEGRLYKDAELKLHSPKNVIGRNGLAKPSKWMRS